MLQTTEYIPNTTQKSDKGNNNPNSLIWSEISDRKMKPINYIIVNGYWEVFHPHSKLARYLSEIKGEIKNLDDIIKLWNPKCF
ncbi:hypothetical protein ASJ81_08965 [Methanosarcina spelaei]|uniref:Uncharacterized protein n=1 Tax=Methanosarcina spelaei TaxID=1036679 RepID=A0A2A2HQW5_9EURY|nr:hypothetical protein ASJ81_08965 [Methanosarcina spelaei]